MVRSSGTSGTDALQPAPNSSHNASIFVLSSSVQLSPEFNALRFELRKSTGPGKSCNAINQLHYRRTKVGGVARANKCESLTRCLEVHVSHVPR